jgi:hypothetical protein
MRLAGSFSGTHFVTDADSLITFAGGPNAFHLGQPRRLSG